MDEHPQVRDSCGVHADADVGKWPIDTVLIMLVWHRLVFKVSRAMHAFLGTSTLTNKINDTNTAGRDSCPCGQVIPTASLAELGRVCLFLARCIMQTLPLKVAQERWKTPGQSVEIAKSFRDRIRGNLGIITWIFVVTPCSLSSRIVVPGLKRIDERQDVVVGFLFWSIWLAANVGMSVIAAMANGQLDGSWRYIVAGIKFARWHYPNVEVWKNNEKYPTYNMVLDRKSVV